MQTTFMDPNRMQGSLMDRTRPHHRHRPCLILDFKIGAPLVCLLWVVINLYVAVLAFQKRSPIFSHLNSSVLIVQGVTCLLFTIDSLFLFYAYIVGVTRVNLFKGMVYLTWLSIILFAAAYLTSIAVFGIEQDQFLDWCINKSREDVSNYLFSTPPTNDTLLPHSQLTFTAKGNGYNLYNCNRLYQDEIKLAVFLFVFIIALYLHSAYCFRAFVRQREIEQEELIRHMMGEYGHNNNGMMPNTNTLMNIRSSRYTDITEKQTLDDQKSLAQLTRAFFKRLR